MKRHTGRQRHLRNLMSKYEIYGQRSGLISFLFGCSFSVTIDSTGVAIYGTGRCLRHEQIKYFHKWVLNKDEYGELLKRIKN